MDQKQKQALQRAIKDANALGALIDKTIDEMNAGEIAETDDTVAAIKRDQELHKKKMERIEQMKLELDGQDQTNI
jgi:hypothetical protein